MSSDTLKAKKREKVGTRSAKKLRLEGRIPANLQGENQDHVDFSIDMHEFMASRRHHVHLYDLDIDGNVESAVVRELQYDAFGDNIIHVEFKRVIRGQKTDAEVAISYYGHPKGGVLNQLLTHITISCLPSQIPDSLEVRLGDMGEELMSMIHKCLKLIVVATGSRVASLLQSSKIDLRSCRHTESQVREWDPCEQFFHKIWLRGC